MFHLHTLFFNKRKAMALLCILVLALCWQANARVWTGEFDACDLAPLKGIYYVQGSVTIQGCDYLHDLDALDTLISIKGDLNIVLNQDLIHVDGLHRLQMVAGALRIDSNRLLENLDGLGRLLSLPGDLYIVNNDHLYDVDGLHRLEAIGGTLSIGFNIELQHVRGLAALRIVSGNIYVYENHQLQSPYGLIEVREVGGIVDITNNALIDFAFDFKFNWGLPTVWAGDYTSCDLGALEKRLVITGTLVLLRCDKLVHLDALRMLEHIEGSLIIAHNPVLLSLRGLAALHTVNDNVRVVNNTDLTDAQWVASVQVGGTITLWGNARR